MDLSRHPIKFLQALASKRNIETFNFKRYSYEGGPLNGTYPILEEKAEKFEFPASELTDAGFESLVAIAQAKKMDIERLANIYNFF